MSGLCRKSRVIKPQLECVFYILNAWLVALCGTGSPGNAAGRCPDPDTRTVRVAQFGQHTSISQANRCIQSLPRNFPCPLNLQLARGVWTGCGAGNVDHGDRDDATRQPRSSAVQIPVHSLCSKKLYVTGRMPDHRDSVHTTCLRWRPWQRHAATT